MALLCNAWKEAHYGCANDLLYIVFARDAVADARASLKFPKDMSIQTSHSFVMQTYFGANVQLEPIGSYSVKEAVALLKLDDFVTNEFPELVSTAKEKRAKQIARYTITTVNYFQQSTAKVVDESHVCKKATKVYTSKRFRWRSTIPPSNYVAWAQALFNESKRLCDGLRCGTPVAEATRIPHDAYMKVAQLDETFAHPYRCIIVDEAQDMTPCQAELFWGSSRQAEFFAPTVFLVGDAHQRIYGFRGASNSFEMASTNKMFPLTGSFRFGDDIARHANLVLGSQFPIKGLSANKGEIRPATEFSKGAVVCRTNNGMLKFLLHHFLLKNGSIQKWAFYGKSVKLPAISQKLLQLEKFVHGVDRPFKHDGEEFSTLPALEEYIEDSQDLDLGRYLSLLKELSQCKMSLQDFVAKIKVTQVPRDKIESVDDFNGAVLMTCHAAKGLEFDSVLVYDDFPFQHLMNPKIIELVRQGRAYPYFYEAKDLVYVAVTRAKKRLYLSQGAKAYFDFLDETTPEPPFKCARRNLFAKAGIELRQELDDAWKIFQGGTEPIRNVEEIPFPPTSDFGIDGTMAASEIKSHLRVILRRYHPDKFLSQFQSRLVGLAKDTMDAIQSKLKDVTMRAGDLRRSLNRPSDPSADMSCAACRYLRLFHNMNICFSYRGLIARVMRQ